MAIPSISLPEHPARKGHRAKPDLPDLLDLPDRKEPQVRQVLLAPLDHKAYQVLPAPLDHKAPPERASIYSVLLLP